MVEPFFTYYQMFLEKDLLLYKVSKGLKADI